ncbi:uncharacterized protein DS421_20g706590 [Arachis hypogaea]|nr:uncharacterized protein DS421_20g706590 [Arachis hypogaea]
MHLTPINIPIPKTIPIITNRCLQVTFLSGPPQPCVPCFPQMQNPNFEVPRSFNHPSRWPHHSVALRAPCHHSVLTQLNLLRLVHLREADLHLRRVVALVRKPWHRRYKHRVFAVCAVVIVVIVVSIVLLL